MSPLQVATTEDLLAELSSRNEAVVVAMVCSKPGEEDVECFRSYYSGSPTLCIGVATRLCRRMQDRIELDGDEDDDAEEP